MWLPESCNQWGSTVDGWAVVLEKESLEFALQRSKGRFLSQSTHRKVVALNLTHRTRRNVKATRASQKMTAWNVNALDATEWTDAMTEKQQSQALKTRSIFHATKLPTQSPTGQKVACVNFPNSKKVNTGCCCHLLYLLLPTALAKEEMQSPPPVRPSVCPSVCNRLIVDLELMRVNRSWS